MNLNNLDIDAVAKAIEADAGESFPDLRQALKEAKDCAVGRATTPDVSDQQTIGRLDQTAAAAAYDKWLKEEVQEAIDDTRPSISNEEVKKHFAEKREALRKRIADKVQASRDGLASGTNRVIESDEWASIRAGKEGD